MFFVRSITTDIISTSFIFCDTKLIAKLSLYFRNNEIVINEYMVSDSEYQSNHVQT